MQVQVCFGFDVSHRRRTKPYFISTDLALGLDPRVRKAIPQVRVACSSMLFDKRSWSCFFYKFYNYKDGIIPLYRPWDVAAGASLAEARRTETMPIKATDRHARNSQALERAANNKRNKKTVIVRTYMY